MIGIEKNTDNLKEEYSVDTTRNNAFRIDAWVGSDLGQVRKRNEDSYFVDSNNKIFIVADGMGGGVQGDRASKRAIEVFTTYLQNNSQILQALEFPHDQGLRDKVKEVLLDAIQAANMEILKLRNSMGKVAMGTTLSALLIRGKTGVIAHIGDSRIYRVRYREVEQLTDDHSLVAQQVRDGVLTEEEAENSPFKNVLLQAIGKGEKIQPQIKFIEIEVGDQFLICSDGLSNYIKNDEIIALLNEPAGERIVPRLIDSANSRGGSDNITAIVIRISSPEHFEPTQQYNFSDIQHNSPLLRGLKRSETAQIFQLGSVQTYISGELICSEQDADRALFLILSGVVNLYRNNQWLMRLEAGKHFGQFSMLDNQGRIATAIAETEVRVLRIERQEFIDFVRRDTALGVKVVWNILKDMSFSYRGLLEKFIERPGRGNLG